MLYLNNPFTYSNVLPRNACRVRINPVDLYTLYFNMLIINVDDDGDDRELFSSAVEAADPEISCKLFESGKDLFDFLESTLIFPDFMFVDINMPRMNGYECVRAIRLQKRFEHVKIIMHSTAFNPNDKKEFDEMGLEFLIKPSRLSDLVESIKELIA